MSEPPALGHHKLEQPLAVEFIAHHLPEYHAAFRNIQARYDPVSRKFVPVSHPAKMPTNHLTPRPTNRPGEATAPARTPTEQAPEQVLETMKYWDMIFPTAMDKFTAETEVQKRGNRDPNYEIRGSKTWQAVYTKLQAAQNHYAKSTGAGGRVRQVWRWVADNLSEPVLVGLRVVPDIDIATPVLAGVEIIVEAIQRSSKIRGDVQAGFDDLQSIMSDVERFVGTHKGEERLLDHAVVLISSVLLAIDRAIAFFTRPSVIRGIQATFKTYAANLLRSLGMITSNGVKFMAEVEKLHFVNSDEYSKATMRLLEKLREGQKEAAFEVRFLSLQLDDRFERQEERDQQMENRIIEAMKNKFSMLNDKYEEERMNYRSFLRQQREELKRKEEELARKEQSMDLERAAWEAQAYSGDWSEPVITQEELWNLLNMAEDIDTADMDLIDAKKSAYPMEDQAFTEQIVRSQLFENWMVSALSSRMLVHGDFHSLAMETSALSLLCTVFTKAFRAKKNYLCLVWFCGRHQGDEDPYFDDGYSDSDEEDGYAFDEYPNNGDDNESYGPDTIDMPIKKMLRSFIAQLLCDFPFQAQGLSLIPPEADLSLIERGSISELRSLLCWLICQLPEEITLFCLIDDIVFYEREEFEDPMLDVLGDILHIAAVNAAPAAIKVLLTSPRPTAVVRHAFEADEDENDSLIMSLDALEPSQREANIERMNRELEGE